MPANDSDAQAVVEIQGISKCYGGVQAVDNVSLSIRRGELFGLIGHNGAGKSTLFKMMLGLIPPSAGSIRIAGAAIDGNGFREVRRRIGYLPENVVLYDNLTGLETLQFFARLKGVAQQDCTATLERVGLSQAANRRVSGYSKGMRQRLGFAQALLGAPQLLFLDEPTSGLDPEAVRDFYQLLANLRAQGVTVILSSHILAEIQQRVDRLAILAAGRLRALGTLQTLREKIHLPLRISVITQAGQAGTLRQALPIPALEIAETSADTLQIRCPRELKMQVIERLGAQHGKVLDLHVHEPSLEDVFFGFSG